MTWLPLESKMFLSVEYDGNRTARAVLT
jgi:hypothetical protein